MNQLLPIFMMVYAEFEFELGENARIIHASILPETGEEYQRTKTSLGLNANTLWLKVEARDIVSMRAALNGWLRLIKITDEMCSIITEYTSFKSVMRNTTPDL